MNQPKEFTILELVKRSIAGRNVVITLHRQLLGRGIVSGVEVDGNVDCDWLVVKFAGQKETAEFDFSQDVKITIIDP